MSFLNVFENSKKILKSVEYIVLD